MSPEEITVGQIVISAAGRDIGQTYVVMEKLAPPFVLIADGRNHKVTGPKKKNIRHITILRSIAEPVAEKLKCGARITDEDIRHALNQVYTKDQK